MWETLLNCCYFRKLITVSRYVSKNVAVEFLMKSELDIGILIANAWR